MRPERLFRESRNGPLFLIFALFIVRLREGRRNEMSATQKKERDFQAKLIKDIKARFDGCLVMKNDATYIQGIPDLLVLYEDKWAALECKVSEKASKRPNQDYYVSKMDEMSFSRFVYPENEEEVLDELQQTFRS